MCVCTHIYILIDIAIYRHRHQCVASSYSITQGQTCSEGQTCSQRCLRARHVHKDVCMFGYVCMYFCVRVCVCVYVCTYMYAYLHVYTNVIAYIHVYMLYKYMYTYLHVYTYVIAYIHVYMLYKYMYVYIYVWVRVYIYISLYIYICLYICATSSRSTTPEGFLIRDPYLQRWSDHQVGTNSTCLKIWRNVSSPYTMQSTHTKRPHFFLNLIKYSG